MSGHTPGPWMPGASNSVITAAPAELRIICQPFTDATYGPILSREEQEANANLIAAAPCLLEALIGMVEYYQSRSSNEEDAVQAAAYAAIARAKGKA